MEANGGQWWPIESSYRYQNFSSPCRFCKFSINLYASPISLFIKIGRMTKKAIISLHFLDTLVQLMVRVIGSIFLKTKTKTSTGKSLIPAIRKSKLYLRIKKIQLQMMSDNTSHVF